MFNGPPAPAKVDMSRGRVLVDLASTRPEIVTTRNAIVLGQVLVRVLVVS